MAGLEPAEASHCCKLTTLPRAVAEALGLPAALRTPKYVSSGGHSPLCLPQKRLSALWLTLSVQILLRWSPSPQRWFMSYAIPCFFSNPYKMPVCRICWFSSTAPFQRGLCPDEGSRVPPQPSFGSVQKECKSCRGGREGMMLQGMVFPSVRNEEKALAAESPPSDQDGVRSSKPHEKLTKA